MRYPPFAVAAAVLCSTGVWGVKTTTTKIVTKDRTVIETDYVMKTRTIVETVLVTVTQNRTITPKVTPTITTTVYFPSSVTVSDCTNTVTITASSSSSSSSSSTSPFPNACYVTAYPDVSAAVASCTAITLDSIIVPSNTTLDLSKLLPNTDLTFAGTTTWGYYNWTGNLMNVGGTNITIHGAPGHIIDGNGQAWWDGLGGNGGVKKPNYVIGISKLMGMSFLQSLYIQNSPQQFIHVTGSNGLTIQNLILNNTAGYLPNNRSNGLEAAHNTDGFDVSTTNNTVLRNITVLNQDDCVAVTSGVNITVSNVYCNGSHGFSIGSIGGKSNNYVSNVLFENGECDNCQNGARIKSNFNTTGVVNNITWSNISVKNATIYGVDIQQDYLNGGATGNPSNGVIISNITMTNVTGTATHAAADYYILCGNGSCSDITFNNVYITGGGKPSSCNYTPSGDFVCQSD